MNKLKLLSIGVQVSARSTRMFLKHAPGTVAEYAGFLNKFFGVFSKPDSKKDLYTAEDLKEKQTSLFYNICHENRSINSKEMIMYLAEKFDSEPPAEVDLYKPTVVPLHENAQNLFVGGSNTQAYFQIRKYDVFTAALVVAAFKSLLFSKFYPTVALTMLPPWMVWGYGTFTVSRADLLPHQEAISFERIGWRGQRSYEVVKIANLRKCGRFDGNVSGFLTRYSHGFDENLMFRDILTNNVYAFDLGGSWNQDSLKHELLN